MLWNLDKNDRRGIIDPSVQCLHFTQIETEVLIVNWKLVTLFSHPYIY
jgi:hypothetical protein